MLRFSYLVLIVLALACHSQSTKPHISTLSDLPLAMDTSMIFKPTPQLIPLEDGWADLEELDSSILLDIKYATVENFVGEKLYDCGRCILREQVARAILHAQRILQEDNMGLLLYDCYRPLSVQKSLWAKKPDARYVTPPDKGSMHNRGAAVDVTLVTREGRPLDMGTDYDFFGWEAYHTNTTLPDSILQRRHLLKEVMKEVGFRAIRTEWWHYSYEESNYPLSDYQWPCPDGSVSN